MNRNLYLYWTGPEYPLLTIMEKLIILHSKDAQNYKVILITPENVSNYIRIPDCFFNFNPSDQSNYVRVNIICEYGGIWLDMDTIVMNNLNDLFKIMDTYDGFLMLEDNTILVAGAFGSKAHTEFMEEWKNRINRIIASKATRVKWGEISSKAMNDIKKTYPVYTSKYLILAGLDNIYPVSWKNCVQEYLIKPYENYKNLTREFQPVIVLVRSVYIELQNKTVDEILDMNTPINFFINKSVQNLGLELNSFKSAQIAR